MSAARSILVVYSCAPPPPLPGGATGRVIGYCGVKGATGLMVGRGIATGGWASGAVGVWGIDEGLDVILVDDDSQGTEVCWGTEDDGLDVLFVVDPFGLG